MSKDRAGPDSDVPSALRVQYQQIAVRAAAAGRPLHPVPMLEVAAHAKHGSRAIVGPTGGAEVPRVRLSMELLDIAAPDRAWTIAHELSHVLRRQEGARLELTRVPLITAALLGAVAAAAVLAAGYSALLGSGSYIGLLFALAGVGVLGMWLVLVWLIRREETATDATAAAVFGEVLTAAGVERVRRDEGALSRYVPTVLRSHPHPAARRRAGLAARPEAGA